ncbi:MAG: efflux transporter periplasmic adaptor subunit [Candidatus Wallbacteria bacterium HGW-Wallbacteria-1]|jgi:Cu(I)/Ag(I) efflux system membrane fusion protein|uniref:Efflux transporter periplasmic adaptor subunit n=1 Tax=Candidatus Wallbacteria bacterium HGW-Wallbacteria-1 TaxID=2013854 RepID=A0A2N1PN84_9BACT|nr:MAG: efflux transporter periplasmic adaptor subunit [Candidatus Wallbacteria bacterium HGW-Wallbacteria-1]
MKHHRMRGMQSLTLIVIIALSFGAGIFACKSLFVKAFPATTTESKSVVKPTAEEVWTCSMHPQIRLPRKGKCPVCFMDLIMLVSDTHEEDGTEGNGSAISSASDDLSRVRVSDYSRKLMELETVEVKRKFVEAEVRMVGKVEYDETRISYISAWVPGRLERLYVNYTGIPVRKGDHMVEIYSPDLMSAQEELIQALGTVESLKKSDSAIVRRTADSMVRAVREKLRLLGLREGQIREIETSGKSRDRITIYAPAGGIVIYKNASEGMYVQTGTRIYTIADLSSVWIELNAYESDLGWVRYGGKVEFTTEAYPGRIFRGSISFIDPTVDQQTRTSRVRVTVSNESMALKPGMFVRATVRTVVAAGGHVMSSELQGKWISPMHPEIIKAAPGKCDVCGMPLVSAESLGYVSGNEGNAPLVIPVSAALRTGRRAVVYLQRSGYETVASGNNRYEGREVVLGARLGDYYIVEDGLKEGDRVVVRGAFKLDAELQIQARPSMMSQQSDSPFPDSTSNALSSDEQINSDDHASIDIHMKNDGISVNDEFRVQFGEFVKSYFKLHRALAADKPEEVSEFSVQAAEKLKAVNMELLSGRSHMIWMKHLKGLRGGLDRLMQERTLDRQREAFEILSSQLILTVRTFSFGNIRMFRATCPMAFDNKGASWLQDSEMIANPYFGAMMLQCGEINEQIIDPQAGESHE